MKCKNPNCGNVVPKIPFVRWRGKNNKKQYFCSSECLVWDVKIPESKKELENIMIPEERKIQLTKIRLAKIFGVGAMILGLTIVVELLILIGK